MSRPGPLPTDQERQTSFGTTQEREFFKYLPEYALVAPFAQNTPREGPAARYVPRSCPDTVLTAFAQLGALRLNARWAFVSLFGRRQQHILAEATRTLSLQDDASHEESDELWMGSCVMSYEGSFCKHVMDLPQTPQRPEDMVLVMPDLCKDERFKDHGAVTGYPHTRFFASVPIRSPKGIIIGAYTIIDDKPHDYLTAKSFKFMTDMAFTVMRHLETTRAKAQHLRGERMIVGLGSFLEGKASLRTSWLEESGLNKKVDEGTEPQEGHINQPQQAKQITDDTAKALEGPNALKRLLPLRPRGMRRSAEERVSRHNNPEEEGSTAATARTTRAKGEIKYEQQEPDASVPPSRNEPTKDVQNDSHPPEVIDTFSRAANILRESIEVEGVVFLDANFRSHGGLVANSSSDSDGSSSDSAALSDGLKSRRTPLSEGSSESGMETVEDRSSPCGLLGFSTTDWSSINDQLGQKKIAVSESFLKGLLHRYPQGKIFNYSEEGAISSDDTSDGAFKNLFHSGSGTKNGDKVRPPVRRYKKTRRTATRYDAKVLLQLAPGSRSIIFSPLWDSHKGRWYSGCLAWTKTPHRVFISDDELAFLFALGNSAMAEIHRIGAEFADRAKSDLLSSLSHELRSPLHGIFGTSEILSDTFMNAYQHGLLHTIQSCASTLLDTINHLLEYAGINNIQRESLKVRSARNSRSAGSGASVQPDPSLDLNSCLELDSAVEEVLESVFAGHAFLHESKSPLRRPGTPGVSLSGGPQHNGLDTDNVKLVLDVSRGQNWRFLSQPGAWRLILVDILGNALKFTQSGFVYVTLKALPMKSTGRSNVVLTVKDTGRGIDEKFLQNEMFAPFAQENSLSAGTGLGLNVTRRTVLSLGGDIQVSSTKGLGTEVTTTIALPHFPEFAPPDVYDAESPIAATRELVRGQSIGILGLGASDLDKMLFSTLKRLCGDWFDMDVRAIDPAASSFESCDYYIASQEYVDLGDSQVNSIPPGPKQRFSSPLIVICSSPENAHAMFSASVVRGSVDIFEFVSQPCGPRKLAKTLKSCLLRQERRHASPDDQDASRPVNGKVVVSSQEAGKVPDDGVIKNGHSPANGVHREHPDDASASSQGGPVQSSVSPEVVDDSDQQETPPTEKEELSKTSELGSKVLIVDDNEINVRILVAFMKKLNCEYEVAWNGLEALEAFKAAPASFSAVLMDISMPVMDGLQSTREIRDHEHQLQTPKPVAIIALTGLGQADIQRDAIGSGMDLFLTKPVPLKKLAPIIEEAQGCRDPA